MLCILFIRKREKEPDVIMKKNREKKQRGLLNLDLNLVYKFSFLLLEENNLKDNKTCNIL